MDNEFRRFIRLDLLTLDDFALRAHDHDFYDSSSKDAKRLDDLHLKPAGRSNGSP